MTAALPSRMKMVHKPWGGDPARRITTTEAFQQRW